MDKTNTNDPIGTVEQRQSELAAAIEAGNTAMTEYTRVCGLCCTAVERRDSVAADLERATGEHRECIDAAAAGDEKALKRATDLRGKMDTALSDKRNADLVAKAAEKKQTAAEQTYLDAAWAIEVAEARLLRAEWFEAAKAFDGTLGDTAEAFKDYREKRDRFYTRMHDAGQHDLINRVIDNDQRVLGALNGALGIKALDAHVFHRDLCRPLTELEQSRWHVGDLERPADWRPPVAVPTEPEPETGAEADSEAAA